MAGNMVNKKSECNHNVKPPIQKKFVKKRKIDDVNDIHRSEFVVNKGLSPFDKRRELHLGKKTKLEENKVFGCKDNLKKVINIGLKKIAKTELKPKPTNTKTKEHVGKINTLKSLPPPAVSGEDHNIYRFGEEDLEEISQCDLNHPLIKIAKSYLQGQENIAAVFKAFDENTNSVKTEFKHVMRNTDDMDAYTKNRIATLKLKYVTTSLKVKKLMADVNKIRTELE
ncbi:uncharacterized protein LOC119687931 [Teleopsis dalmanni]|uniref:uncharacterized protein LOC119687931 n=1 Tax=Teleopsis dalmanni TaxID=139649 RepID=UPI0018CE12A4|nr:uncharacterized protein LOC119687931 [Teleopsis dalmanni]